MMTTNFPNGDRAILVWSFLSVKHIGVSFAGHNMDLATDNGQVTVKLDIKKGAQPDQVSVDVVTTQGTGEPVTTSLSVMGIPTGSDGKPLSVGSIMTPAITKEQTLKPKETVVVAKGAGAFPSLTATLH
jgi:hypothetical protein